MNFRLFEITYIADLLSRREGEEVERLRALAVLDKDIEVSVPLAGRVTRGTFELRKVNQSNRVIAGLHYNEPTSYFQDSPGGHFAGYIEVADSVFNRILQARSYGGSMEIYIDFGTGAEGLDFISPKAFLWQTQAHRMLRILGASITVSHPISGAPDA